MKQLKILYISDIALESTSGSGRVMRTLFEDDRFCVSELSVLSPHSVVGNSRLVRAVAALFARICRSRLAGFARPVLECMRCSIVPERIIAETRHLDPDIIVTVVLGFSSSVAVRLGSITNTPVISFFHDWWPEVERRKQHSTGILHALIEREFMRISRMSELNFCISEGMRDALGATSNCRVMLPIPNQSADVSYAESFVDDASEISDEFRILYTGDIGYGYGEALRGLADALSGSGASLVIHGEPRGWSKCDIKRFSESGILRPPIRFQDYYKALAGSSMLLAIGSFREEDRVYSSTSFPSKIASYALTDKPIMFWGPIHSAVARFCMKHNAGLLVLSQDPSEIRQRVIQLMSGVGGALAARTGLKELFSPDAIRNEFHRAAVQICESTGG